MLKRKEPYDEAKHMKAMGLPEKLASSRSKPSKVRDEIVEALGDVADFSEIDAEKLGENLSQGAPSPDSLSSHL